MFCVPLRLWWFTRSFVPLRLWWFTRPFGAWKSVIDSLASLERMSVFWFACFIESKLPFHNTWNIQFIYNTSFSYLANRLSLHPPVLLCCFYTRKLTLVKGSKSASEAGFCCFCLGPDEIHFGQRQQSRLKSRILLLLPETRWNSLWSKAAISPQRQDFAASGRISQRLSINPA